MESHPVIVRTDASAEDFWSRFRNSVDVSPDFKLNTFAKQIQISTPFGKQTQPRIPPKRGDHVDIFLPRLRSSRSVERNASNFWSGEGKQDIREFIEPKHHVEE